MPLLENMHLSTKPIGLSTYSIFTDYGCASVKTGLIYGFYSEFNRSDSKSMFEYLVVIQELSGLQKFQMGEKEIFN